MWDFFQCYVKCILFIHSFIGKTLLAKAVANQTAATFLRVVGSELIQKYLVGGTKYFVNKRRHL